MCASALAQVPETGRWQELAFSEDALQQHTAVHYRQLLQELTDAHQIDDDDAMTERAQRVAATILRAAAILEPKVKNWQWELHTSSTPDIDAYCMAGGKMIVGSQFVRRLDLNDGELAALIGHEVAHALAQHHRETLSEARLINPQPESTLAILSERLDLELPLQIQLGSLSSIQETEADQIGMTLAHLAGWSSADFVSFYKKLQADDPLQDRARSHPSAASRVSMAKGMALLLALSRY
ncbi:M48 family metalloprotease [Actimicrobium sp. CCI2.3]|uniref:M48 family metalloprotease n=1 Tax=Actimicrobium sp. CCI2.3 TaxID=3048616 RepID=UPI002AB5AAEB|nr:M48 family metalloprotease [Actimicrobium sp. CCI2.3]MDY7576157.1 M48 family metalloprotease [Actimicrobium sp. CCI2.3]MEB0023441.1 M48 family metalloprotease [Actimicrobium sp. CCI2.3]